MAWWVLLAIVVACDRPTPPDTAHPDLAQPDLAHPDLAQPESGQSAGTTADAPAPPGAPGRCFIGPLYRNEPTSHSRPSEYCVDDVSYLGASHRLGRRNLFGVDRGGGLEGGFDPGGYVRVQATEKRDLFAALKRRGPCDSDGGPMPQMRGDWVPEEGSYHTTAERLRDASYLESLSIAPIDLVTVDAPPPGKRGPPADPKAQVRVQIRNALAAPLEGLTVVVHYEGGKRKPMPRYREEPLPTTAPGATTTLNAPASLQEGEAWYHFTSVSIEGTAAGCQFVSSTYRR